MTLLSVILAIIIFAALLAACCRIYNRSSNTDTSTHTVIVEPPGGGDSMTTRTAPSAPLAGNSGSIQGPPTRPSAPVQDLPPAYDSVFDDPSKFAFPPGQIDDPSKFAFPPGQIGSDGGVSIPLAPPPGCYTPQQVYFSAAKSDHVAVTQSTDL